MFRCRYRLLALLLIVAIKTIFCSWEKVLHSEMVHYDSKTCNILPSSLHVIEIDFLGL